jgi:hypothetical protein
MKLQADSPPRAVPTDRTVEEMPWARHPADVARFVFALIVGAIVILISAAAASTTLSTARDIVRVFDHVPAELRDFLAGLIQLVAIAAPIVIVVIIVVRRRWRMLGLLTLAATAASISFALLNMWLAARAPRVILQDRLSKSWLTGAAFPSTTYLAGAVAVVVAGSAWVGIGLIAMARLLAARRARARWHRCDGTRTDSNR